MNNAISSAPISNFGFKEWALICGALENGAQSLIIRKGGIAEGRNGFQFKHDAFFLFPTLFHEQKEKTTLPAETPLPVLDPETISLNLYAQVEWTALITDWETVSRLAPFHFWSESTVAERFTYDEPSGVYVAVLRVFRLSQPWEFPNAPKYGGCRSWLTLPEVPEGLGLTPVLDDEAHASRVAAIRAAIAQ